MRKCLSIGGALVLVAVSALALLGGMQGGGRAGGAQATGVDGSANPASGETGGKMDAFPRDRMLGVTERISVSSTGEQGNKESGLDPAISEDGRFVAFNSAASNLVPGDTNGVGDVFVRDRKTGKTERLSVNSKGEQANGNSRLCGIHRARCISADGCCVAFESEATNLAPADTNGVGDVFVRDWRAGTTERVSIAPSGGQFNLLCMLHDITPDGRFVLFTGQMLRDGGGEAQLYVRDRRRGATEQITSPCADYETGTDGTMSRDGRFVAFQGRPPSGGRQPWTRGIWLLDRKTGRREKVSADTEVIGSRKHRVFGLPIVSNDGRFVVFWAYDGPLLGRLGVGRDIFLRDREKRAAEAVNVGPGGEEANGDAMPDAMTRDGRFVVFSSNASNLVPGDTNDHQDVFLRDRLLGTTTRVSVTAIGEQANLSSWCGTITSDRRFIAFSSWASNLVPGDTNGKQDVFLLDRGPAAK